MPASYSRLPTHNDRDIDEMEAAFDDSDDENIDDQDNEASQRRPLVPRDPATPPHVAQYDFERVDYDYPPPGSPPRPSSFALPTGAAFGNSNGLVPEGPIDRPAPRPRRDWLSRIFPWSASGSRPRAGIGGGSENDGVFANLTSKPTRPMRIEDADGVHIVPEETQAEAPPVCPPTHSSPSYSYLIVICCRAGRRSALVLGNHHPCTLGR
jgi:hypothetical protein